jgi:anti-anti-sigma factor
VAPLELSTALEGAAAVVSLYGELDLAGSPLLEEEVGRLTRNGQVATVVLDLRRLEFLDSSGLRAVALSQRRVEGAGQALVLVRGPETVQRVFEITRMVDRLRFVDSPDAVDAERSP